MVWLGLGGLLAAVGAYFFWPTFITLSHLSRLRTYLADPAAHPDWEVLAGQRCGEAPFVIPTDGYLGFGYGASWQPGQRHQGFDIFGPTPLGQTPVLAAYPGYLTRLPEWKSTVIIRVPHDPLNPDRQIWVYYTHMADADGNAFISADFPPDTREQFVRAGTVLGYQGNYSGDPRHPVGMHLHISIVKDDGSGQFLNELKIENTLDPSPYLGLQGRAGEAGDKPVTCESASSSQTGDDPQL